MKTNFFNTTIVIIAAFFFTIPVVAQEKTVIKATVDRSQILIGEPIKLTLEADVPEHEPIRFFQFDSIPHFEFLNVQKIDTTNTVSGTVLSQIIHITSFDSGHWIIPSFTIGENIVTDSIPVDVGFAPFNPDQPYHDIKDIIEVTPEEKKEEKIKWWYIVAGVAALLLILVLIFRKKKKPVVQAIAPPPDPFLVAMGKLEKLQKERPDTKQYYSWLVDIFREYVFAKKGIHSMQDTTDDLVKQLRSLNMPKDQLEKLTQSLRLSDFVKFAKYVPTDDDDKNTFTTIGRSIQQIEQIQ
jgi:LPXTG-motif cell wall-anchored protein